MEKQISPSEVSGAIAAPPSKSYSHRAIICASLSSGKSVIKNCLKSADLNATIDACRAFGAQIEEKDGLIEISGTFPKAPESEVNCGESGSTIRFLIPVFSLAKGKAILAGKPGLCKRPMGPVLDALEMMGVQTGSDEGCPPVQVTGPLNGGKVTIGGDISSQFISGLLFALPICENSSSITITEQLESKPYVDITLEVLSKFDIEINSTADMAFFDIPAKQAYNATDYSVPGDFSSAAFFLCAGAIFGKASIGNLTMRTMQGDKEIVNILKEMCAEIKVDEKKESITAKKSQLKGMEIDVSNMPDLVPILAVLGCYAKGTTKITNASRLRIKESDRLSSIATELKKMGAKIDEHDDALTIKHSKLNGSALDSHNDHRIAMACAIAALGAEGSSTLAGAEAVKKSYPTFWDDFEKITSMR